MSNNGRNDANNSGTFETEPSESLNTTGESNKSNVSNDPYGGSSQSSGWHHATDGSAQGTPHGRTDNVHFMTPSEGGAPSPGAGLQESAQSTASTYIYDSTLKENFQKAHARAQGEGGVCGPSPPESSPPLPPPAGSPSSGSPVADASARSVAGKGSRSTSPPDVAGKRKWLDDSFNPRGTHYWRSEEVKYSPSVDGADGGSGTGQEPTGEGAAPPPTSRASGDLGPAEDGGSAGAPEQTKSTAPASPGG